jgi:hypothetical protein
MKVQLNAATRLLADGEGTGLIAPADGFQEQNKDQLKDQQKDHKKSTESEEPKSETTAETDKNESKDSDRDTTETNLNVPEEGGEGHDGGQKAVKQSEGSSGIDESEGGEDGGSGDTNVVMDVPQDNEDDSSGIDAKVAKIKTNAHVRLLASMEVNPDEEDEEVLSDADPKLFNTVNQPLG